MPDITAPIVDFATSQIGSYGLLAVFLLMLLESACIPVPSEAIMLYGGFLVATEGENLVPMIAAGVLGNVVGSWVAYGVGHGKGREWALKIRWLHITERRLGAADRWFERWGSWAVLVSRCLPIIRTFISLPAGVARMPFWRFTALTLIGCIPWVTGLTLAGRAVGDNWEDLRTQLHYFDYVLILAAIGGIVYLVIRQRRRIRLAPDPVATEEGTA
jgi:membrane protein DedA with SNARE-associated domain